MASSWLSKTDMTVDMIENLSWQRSVFCSYVGNIWLRHVIEARATSKDPSQTRWDQHYALPFHSTKSPCSPQSCLSLLDGSSINDDILINIRTDKYQDCVLSFEQRWFKMLLTTYYDTELERSCGDVKSISRNTEYQLREINSDTPW